MTTTAKSMKQICTAVMAEGGSNPTSGQVVTSVTGTCNTAAAMTWTEVR